MYHILRNSKIYLFRIEKLVESGIIVRWKRLYYPTDLCSISKKKRLSSKYAAGINVNALV